MKDQFAGAPNEDVASHLNAFVELCDMQKKKYVDNDVVRLKLFLFYLRDRAKNWFSSLPRNSTILGISARMFSLLSIFRP